MIQVLPLKGFKSLRALNAFHTLLLGLKMLPAHIAEDYVTFFDAFDTMSDGKKETLLREALAFVELSRSEVEAVLSFTTDANGIPIGEANIASLTPDVIFESIVAVGMEISRIKIDLLSAEEKKK